MRRDGARDLAVFGGIYVVTRSRVTRHSVGLSVCLSVNQSVTSRRGSDQIEQCSVLHVPKGNRIAIQNTATYTRTVVPPFPYFLLDRGLWSSANG